MKDIHSHLLYGLDDGSRNLEQSIELLNKVKELGFDEIVITPHYNEKYNYTANNKAKEEILKKLKKEVKDIKMYLGNEVFITDNIIENIKAKNISTLNNSKYILVEFPFDVYYTLLEDNIELLIEKGYVPVLAHPERYEYFQNHPEKAKSLMKKGVLMQCNYGSIIGIYGRKAKKCVKKLLKLNLIYCFSLDLHSDGKVLKKFNKIKSKITKMTSESKFKKLSDKNIEKIINNK